MCSDFRVSLGTPKIHTFNIVANDCFLMTSYYNTTNIPITTEQGYCLYGRPSDIMCWISSEVDITDDLLLLGGAISLYHDCLIYIMSLLQCTSFA